MKKLEKLKNAMAKKDIPTRFSRIPEWISIGNLALNHAVSGDLRYGVPVGRSMFISGPQGTSKSFLMGNIVKEAQAMGYLCIYIDTENSIDDVFMARIGVDLDEEKFMPTRVFSVEECTEVLSEILKIFDPEEKVGIFVDSLSNLESVQEIEKFEEGKLAATQGLKEKKYKQMIKGTNNRIGDRHMFIVYTTHVYMSQEKYGPATKISGGEGIQFLPSIGIGLTKATLREGQKPVGILVRASTYKTRYQQLGLSVEFDLPYDRGMDPYEGMLPILAKEGVLNQNAAWYSYISATTGEEIKFQKNSLHEHAEELLARYAQVREGSDLVEKDDDAATKEAAVVLDEEA